MSVQDLAQLKKLAEAATPGPWCYETVGDKSNEFVVGVAQHEGKMLTGCLNDQSYDEEAGVYIDEEIVRVSQVAINETGHANYSDARYIAAANPSTILALLAELEASEAALRTLRQASQTQLKDICHLNAQAIFALASLIALIETAAGVFPQNSMGEWLSKQDTFLKAKEALTTNRNAFEERAAALAAEGGK